MCSSDLPTYQIIKVPNENHMNVMKTSLTIIPMCPRERSFCYKKLSRLVLCYKKDWATLLHLIYFHYLLPVTNYLITKLSVTYNFSACREYLAENRLSFPFAPRWFDTLTYRKDYDRSPILVGHQGGAGVGGGVGGAASAVESRGDRAERVRESQRGSSGPVL